MLVFLLISYSVKDNYQKTMEIVKAASYESLFNEKNLDNDTFDSVMFYNNTIEKNSQLINGSMISHIEQCNIICQAIQSMENTNLFSSESKCDFIIKIIFFDAMNDYMEKQYLNNKLIDSTYKKLNKDYKYYPKDIQNIVYPIIKTYNNKQKKVQTTMGYVISIAYSFIVFGSKCCFIAACTLFFLGHGKKENKNNN